MCHYVCHQQCKETVVDPCRKLKFLGDDENPDTIQFEHFWTPGNCYSRKCFCCGKKVKAPKGGFDKTCKCATCGQFAHTDCVDNISPENRFCRPQFANMMFCDDLLAMDIPPKNYKPLLVFINHKSGGQQGVQVLRELKALLTPEQSISLLNETPGMFFTREKKKKKKLIIFYH